MTNNVEENKDVVGSISMDPDEKKENVPAISLDIVLGYLASLADSLEQISRRIKDDVNGLIVQVNKDNQEEIHEGDMNNDDSE